MENIERIKLTSQHWKIMLDHVLATLPLEGCGLLGGAQAEVKLVIPVKNSLDSPVRFRMDPEEQLVAMMDIEAKGLSIVGIFHSHVRGPSFPSATDVAEVTYPEVAQLIWFPDGDHWNCRAFRIDEDGFYEIPIHLGSDQG
jgi:proteasome lid subunit RPN8/RPN11